MIEEVITSQGGEDVPDMDVKALFGMSLKGEGTLLWNMAAGHLANFDMKADAGLDVAIEVHAKQEDNPVDVNMSGKAEGKLTWELAPTTK